MNALYHPYVIAIANQKGGVAKTTTVVSLGGALVNHNKEVLLVDLDPQANLTLALGKDPGRLRGSISQVFFNSASLNSVSRDTPIPGLDLVPSNAEMDTAERFLPLRKHYETILSRALHNQEPNNQPEILATIIAENESEQPAVEQYSSDDISFQSNQTLNSAETTSQQPNASAESKASEITQPLPPAGNSKTHSALPYDFILLDCPPYIGAVTLNAIIAADLLLIPTQPEFFSAHALRTMMLTIKHVRNQFNPNLIYRILVTMLDRRNRIHRQVNEQIRQTFGNGVLNSIIEIDTKLRESAVQGMPITHHPAAKRTHPPRSALQYDALAQELISYVESR